MTMDVEAARAPERRYARVVARAWTDPAYRLRLEARPAEVLREAGYHVPAGATVQVVAERPAADSDAVRYVVLPPLPVVDIETVWARAMAEKPGTTGGIGTAPGTTRGIGAAPATPGTTRGIGAAPEPPPARPKPDKDAEPKKRGGRQKK